MKVKLENINVRIKDRAIYLKNKEKWKYLNYKLLEGLTNSETPLETINIFNKFQENKVKLKKLKIKT